MNVDAGLWRDQRAPDNDAAEWDLWRFRAEKMIGHPVTDGMEVDALYALYLQDMEPERAAIVLMKALTIAWEAQAILAKREANGMREEDEFDRFQPSAAEPDHITKDEYRMSRRFMTLAWIAWGVLILGLSFGIYCTSHISK